MLYSQGLTPPGTGTRHDVPGAKTSECMETQETGTGFRRLTFNFRDLDSHLCSKPVRMAVLQNCCGPAGSETTEGSSVPSTRRGCPGYKTKTNPSGLRHSNGTGLQCASLRGAGLVSGSVNESEEPLDLSPLSGLRPGSALTSSSLVTSLLPSPSAQSHPVA